MANKELVNFIKEARKKGFDDYQIKEPLLKHGWPIEEIDKAFASLKPQENFKFKNKITVFVSNDVLRALEKRAKKNLLTIPEQIDDILRRSCIRSGKIKKEQEKIDDLLVSIFSRRKRK
jgi:DNA-binding transcriptional regulator YhcF (GntR family)